ncbi:hypothetical protein [Nocardia beijingensis]|uniref:hypothetical protein n=1 Tax=Nocardia beijingensis TaxID=95162 RepID=UPI000833C406|nr:hypothetical protein [Nocardia beijingensis]
MLFQADLPEPRRNEAIAHGVVHVELAEEEYAAGALLGMNPRLRVEAMVDDIVSRRLIPLPDLHDALALAATVPEVAAALGVSQYLLAERLRNMSEDEARLISTPLLDRLGWVPGLGEKHHRVCLWPTPGSGDLLRRISAR